VSLLSKQDNRPSRKDNNTVKNKSARRWGFAAVMAASLALPAFAADQVITTDSGTLDKAATCSPSLTTAT
jgi:hypothetical protein